MAVMLTINTTFHLTELLHQNPIVFKRELSNKQDDFYKSVLEEMNSFCEEMEKP